MSVSASDEPAVGLGLAHATLKWNKVEEKQDQGNDKNKNKNNKPAVKYSLFTSRSRTEDDSATAVDSTSVVDSAEIDRRFELTDVSVMFPEGELSIITGPTGSGKTALLASTYPKGWTIS